MTDATEAVRLAETTADKDILAQALDVLGTAQLAQGDVAAAAATLNREVTVAAEAKKPMAAWFAYSNRSDVYKKTAETCNYEQSYDQCFQAFDRAKADLEKALAIAQRLGYYAIAAQTEQFIRNVETLRANVAATKASHAAFEKADIFHPKKPADVLVEDTFVPPPDRSADLVGILALELSQQPDPQLRPFLSAVDARSEFLQGNLNEFRQNHDAALTHYLKAIDLLDADRRALRDERSRGTIGADRIEFYYAAVQQLLDHRRYADAFEVFERSRSRALADLLASRSLSFGRPESNVSSPNQPRCARRSPTRRAVSSSSRPGAASRMRPRSKPYEPRFATSRIRTSSCVPGSRQRPHASTTSSRRSPRPSQRYSGRCARNNTRSCNTSCRPTVYSSGTSRPNSVVVRNVFLPRQELTKKVATLQASLADRNVAFDQTTARELFLYLIQPIASRIATDHLVIIPHEDLQYLPFEVLQDPADGRHLGERFQITSAPSASVLLSLRRSTSLSGGRLLAVADPGITAAGREVTAIAQQFPSRNRVVSDPLASETDVKGWVRDYDVIHLSVHGKYDAAEPMLSYLLLGQSGSDDGRLTAAEMFGLPLEKSRIVVLSACETGRAEATHGNEILGMMRALLYAAGGTLVLSHWEVNSEATALWMQTFYEAAASHPVPEAARMALVKVKSNPAYSHPYYWAAFGVVGR